MSELAHAANTILSNRGLGLHVIENGNKTFSFVGAVPAVLSYYRPDGLPLTDSDIDGIRHCGAGIFRKTIGLRVYNTREEAIAAAAAIGYSVNS